MDLAKILQCMCLCIMDVYGRTFVKRIIFYNDPGARAADIQFSEAIVVENLLLSKRVDKNNTVDVTSLTRYIVEPENYSKKVAKAVRTNDPSSTNYKEAMTSNVKADLERVDFQEDTVYSFKVHPINSNSPIYSETFVYSDGNLIYEQEKKKDHWYTNIWVWCSIVFMVLIFLLLVKLCCY